MSLPHYLQHIDTVLCDPEAEPTAIAKRVRQRLPAAVWTTLPGGGLTDMSLLTPSTLYLKHYRGAFLRFCPGTRYYRCCAYRIAHIGENCPLGCAYCILQAYFEDKALKTWANTDDLFAELDRTFCANPAMRYRIGTGEFTDSLVLEPLTGMARDMCAFLQDYDNVVLELKSKTADLSWLPAARPDRVLPAWSLNAPSVQRDHEPLTATLEERLAAAKECAGHGFRVCLHFDPILPIPEWRKEYSRTIEMIFDYLQPKDIAYLSMGSFRYMPKLAQVLEDKGNPPAWLYAEYVRGLDNKQRIVRPLRTAQLRHAARELQRRGVNEQLYLCMESDYVWRAALGRTPRELGGLAKHLERLAFGE